MAFPLIALLPALEKVLDRVLPNDESRAEAKLKLAELQAQGDLEVLKAETSLALGQIEVNKVEAQSSSLFVAGWRPWIGWVCGAGFAYSVVLQPVFQGLITGTFPVVNINILETALWGLLGLGAYRTADKAVPHIFK